MEVLAREEKEEEKQWRIDEKKKAKNKNINKRPAQEATDTTRKRVELEKGQGGADIQKISWTTRRK
eukprot:4640691-Heterocapsa_arctica.AAC.1